MQHMVQLAVLRTINDNPGIGGLSVCALIDADYRDLGRAFELLDQAGALASDSDGVSPFLPDQRMWLTEASRRVLIDEQASGSAAEPA